MRRSTARARTAWTLALVLFVPLLACAGGAALEFTPRPAVRGAEFEILQEVDGAPEARLLSTDGATEFAIVHQASRDSTILLIVNVLGRPRQNIARVRVLASYGARTMPRRHLLLMGDCRVNGRTDADVLALINLASRDSVSSLRAAWRVTPAKDSLVQLDQRSVACPWIRLAS